MTNLNTILSQNSKFEKWYKNFMLWHVTGTNNMTVVSTDFFRLPFDMKYGVVLRYLREEQGIVFEYQRSEWAVGEYHHAFIPVDNNGDLMFEPISDTNFNSGLQSAIINAIQLTEGEG